ncbi:COP9 signalosome complex subunit 3 [Hondaea fermentalgiana]|uniref:COP9 signalosome complex subunit 3 n=1 Tax=Hondaea fermentalgiana TaxID=2315210 RepID=A0A2R5G756_9STRA|nr:COP9 signalosome complex subunit 3 [Hondaea fermentalgiana]|eukprot:GBG25628.1 COP9 signalosome complex subunit 3 [Hondaea fermentalgiana]
METLLELLEVAPAEAAPAREQDLYERIEKLRKCRVQIETGPARISDIEDAIKVADPARTPLCALFLLLAALKVEAAETAQETDGKKAIIRVTTFTNEVAPNDLFCAHREVGELASFLSSSANNNVLLAVCALQAASKLLQIVSSVNAGAISPAHVHFLQVALVAKDYRAAGDLVDQSFFSAVPYMEALDVQRFFYYKGRALVGLRRFEDALAAFEMVLTLPAKDVSAVALAAFKHLHLVSLIARGAIAVLPPAAPVPLQNAFGRQKPIPQIEPYETIAKAFASGQRQTLRDSLRAQTTVLINDNNMGLAKELDRALLRQRVRELKAVYSTLRISDMISLIEAPPIRMGDSSSSSASTATHAPIGGHPKRPAQASAHSQRPSRPPARGPEVHSGAGAATGEHPVSSSSTVNTEGVAGGARQQQAAGSASEGTAAVSASSASLLRQTEQTSLAPHEPVFADCVEKLSVSHLEEILWELIEDEDFPVSIAQDTGIVTLLSSLPDQAARDATALERQMGHLQRLLEDLHKLDISVSGSQRLISQLADTGAPAISFAT